jgi:hypothetical protein
MDMKLRIPTTNAIRVSAVNTAEQTRRIDQTIAHRAYEIFEQRGGMGWHELDDWRQAESEIRSTLCFGLTGSDDALLVAFNIANLVAFNIANFEKDSVEIWVAPRQMIICGKPIAPKEKAAPSHPYHGVVFRVVALPAEVEVGRVSTSLKHNFLEVRLPRVHSRQVGRALAYACDLERRV